MGSPVINRLPPPPPGFEVDPPLPEGFQLDQPGTASETGRLSLGHTVMRGDTASDRLARNLSAYIPAAVGLIGSVAGIPAGPPGMVAGGAVGSGTGEAIRQLFTRFALGGGPETSTEAATGIGEQGVYGALAEMFGLGVARLPGALAGRVRFANNLNPVEQEAVDFARSRGIPVDIAQASGNEFLQGAKELTAKAPLGAAPAAAAARTQGSELARVGTKLAKSIAPGGATSKLTAGERVAGRVRGRITEAHRAADVAYSDLRDIASRHTKRIQVGEKVGAYNPITGTRPRTPIFREIELPVDYRQAKQALRPIADILEQTIPSEQRASNPGLAALRDVIGADDYVPMEVAIRDLSRIQDISRSTIRELRGKSSGLAAAAQRPLREAVDAAAASAGNDAVAALESGRAATRTKYRIAEIGKRLGIRNTEQALPPEPAALAAKLMRNDDASLYLLRNVQKVAPDTIPDLARATVEGIIRPSTASGGFRKSGMALNRWERIGSETKGVLFTTQQRGELNNFFRFAEMASRRANPSGSATVGSIVATGLYALHNPLTGAVTVLAPRQFAKVLLAPNGPELLRQGLNVPTYSKTGHGIATMLRMLAAPDEEPEE